MRGPKFVQYFVPLLEALKELGGSGRPDEVVDFIATKVKLMADDHEQLNNGRTRFQDRVAWARFYLAKAGFIDASTRGVWSLTEKGLNTTLSASDALNVFREVQSTFKNITTSESGAVEQDPESIVASVTTDIPTSHRSILLETLKTLSPSGFERLCQRILREAGFEKVEVTGKTGDGGIDGRGILRLNPLVSFSVYFQCKRYAGSVGSGVIRDFRGSIMGRADKGIILTTGTFTSDASREAIRDGAIPIELVDGEKLLDMLEQLELGVTAKQITVYEVKHSFFDEFRY